MTFPSITIQGNIISTETLDKFAKEEIEFQERTDFGFKKDTKVRDEIGLAYAMIRGYWNTRRYSGSESAFLFEHQRSMETITLKIHGHNLENYHENLQRTNH